MPSTDESRSPTRNARELHELRVTHIGFLLLENFSLIALASAVDPLRIANMVVGRGVYEYRLIAERAGAVRSCDGIRITPDVLINGENNFDVVFVVGSNPVMHTGTGMLLDWLRTLARKGVALGGLDTGSYVLACAGLLNGYRCTLHGEDVAVLLKRFPQMIVSDRFYEADRDRYTSSGGIAPLDLMVHLIGMSPGSKALGRRVLEVLVAERRGSDRRPVSSLRHHVAAEHAKLDEALRIMEGNVEETLSIAEIAGYMNVSQRQLERWFQERLGKTPANAYLEIRLLRARQLLYRTEKPLEEVCARTGFSSMTHFCTRYKKQFMITPIADRKRYQVGL
ncbi:GlxA family transcriptional regulator [Caballeronia insecticola]|uniref:Transcriptional regulator AraC family n=1 Tax=Caballeronia insecticola TaxID=758793 RepID=R4X2T5_9BURK|nr:GlxA family transcriptional regulator [Caballeronia insecticola]BAN26921.1 transcriptional regulator AraC family [Caballeronia insecticola]